MGNIEPKMVFVSNCCCEKCEKMRIRVIKLKEKHSKNRTEAPEIRENRK